MYVCTCFSAEICRKELSPEAQAARGQHNTVCMFHLQQLDAESFIPPDVAGIWNSSQPRAGRSHLSMEKIVCVMVGKSLQQSIYWLNKASADTVESFGC